MWAGALVGQAIFSVSALCGQFGMVKWSQRLGRIVKIRVNCVKDWHRRLKAQ
jgi:hypothetical protein